MGFWSIKKKRSEGPKVPVSQDGIMCVRCAQWKMRDEDAYCSYCGSPNLPWTLSTRYVRLVAGLEPVATFELHNLSAQQREITLKPTTPACEVVCLEPEGRVQLAGNTVQPVRVTLRQERLPENFIGDKAVFEVFERASERTPQTLHVECLAGPRLEVQPQRLVFSGVIEGGRAVQPLHLSNPGRLPLTIAALRIAANAALSVTTPAPLPLEIAPGQTVTARVAFDATREEGTEASPGALYIVATPLPEIEVPVEFSVKRVRLQASVNEMVFDPCLSLHRKTGRFLLQNVGSEDIVITDVSSADPWIEVRMRDRMVTLGADVPERDAAPRPVASCPVDLLVHAAGLPAGWRETHVTVHTNYENIRLTIPVRARIVTPRPEYYREYIGIDFGTTASVVSLYDGELGPQVLEAPDGADRPSPLIPSVLVMTRVNPALPSSPRNEEYCIGTQAKNRAGMQPDETVRSVKRIMGYGNTRTILGKRFTPEAMASCIIRALVDMTELEIYLKEARQTGAIESYSPVKKAMVTVPANFFDLQIRAILEACRMAGLDIEENERTRDGGIIIDEPSAAAIYHLQRLLQTGRLDAQLQEKGEVVFLVYDHGGGTLDVSVVRITETRFEDGTSEITVQVPANKGNNSVGGDSIDLTLMRAMVDRCARNYPDFDAELILDYYKKLEQRAEAEQWDATTKANVLRARYEWKDAAEELKIRLSTEDPVRYSINAQSIGHLDGKTYQTVDSTFDDTFGGTELQDRIEGLLLQCRDLVKDALEFSGIAPGDVHFVVHTGRTSRMPLIQNNIASLFPQVPNENFIFHDADLKICVAKGAALYGAMRFEITDTHIRFEKSGHRLPHAYGTRTLKRGAPYFDEIIPIGAECPVEGEGDYKIDNGRLSLRFCQNSGKNLNMQNNPDIKMLGDVLVDDLNDGSGKCKVRFTVDANRILGVFVNGKQASIKPQPLEDDERWIG